MSVKRRLRQLEKRLPAPQDLVPWIAAVDENGFVLDDGTPAIKGWVGKPESSLPEATQIIRGVDPLLVFGSARGAA